MEEKTNSIQKPWYKKWWVISLIILGVIGIICIILFITSLIVCGELFQGSSLAGMELDYDISEKFIEDTSGITCMGEGGKQIIIGSGGKRHILCVVSPENKTTYSFEVEKITSLEGESQEEVDSWIVNSNWEGTVVTGSTIDILILDIPKKIEPTTIKIILKEKNMDSQTEKIHTLYIDIKQVGSLPWICRWHPFSKYEAL